MGMMKLARNNADPMRKRSVTRSPLRGNRKWGFSELIAEACSIFYLFRRATLRWRLYAPLRNKARWLLIANRRPHSAAGGGERREAAPAEEPIPASSRFASRTAPRGAARGAAPPASFGPARP